MAPLICWCFQQVDVQYLPVDQAVSAMCAEGNAQAWTGKSVNLYPTAAEFWNSGKCQISTLLKFIPESNTPGVRNTAG
jgi:hypothetical protein